MGLVKELNVPYHQPHYHYYLLTSPLPQSWIREPDIKPWSTRQTPDTLCYSSGPSIIPFSYSFNINQALFLEKRTREIVQQVRKELTLQKPSQV